MKRAKEGMATKKNNYIKFVIYPLAFLLFAYAIYLILPISMTGFLTGTVAMNITVGVTQITTVWNASVSSLTLQAGPNPSSVIINFTAYNGAGFSQINGSSGDINLTNTNSGEVTRYNNTCFNSSSWTSGASAGYMNFTCNITMWWFDKDGPWNITAYVMDNSGNNVSNASTTFRISQTTGFSFSPGNLTWSAIAAGSSNQTSSNDPIVINNTGNAQFGPGQSGNISINATNLRGETTNTLALWAGNFSVSNVTGGGSCSGAACTECSSTTQQSTMTAGAYTNLTWGRLPKGNFTVNNNVTGQQLLYFCVRYAGSELTSQSYSTANESAWTLQIS